MDLFWNNSWAYAEIIPSCGRFTVTACLIPPHSEGNDKNVTKETTDLNSLDNELHKLKVSPGIVNAKPKRDRDTKYNDGKEDNLRASLNFGTEPIKKTVGASSNSQRKEKLYPIFVAFGTGNESVSSFKFSIRQVFNSTGTFIETTIHGGTNKTEEMHEVTPLFEQSELAKKEKNGIFRACRESNKLEAANGKKASCASFFILFEYKFAFRLPVKLQSLRILSSNVSPVTFDDISGKARKVFLARVSLLFRPEIIFSVNTGENDEMQTFNKSDAIKFACKKCRRYFGSVKQVTSFAVPLILSGETSAIAACEECPSCIPKKSETLPLGNGRLLIDTDHVSLSISDLEDCPWKCPQIVDLQCTKECGNMEGEFILSCPECKQKCGTLMGFKDECIFEQPGNDCNKHLSQITSKSKGPCVVKFAKQNVSAYPDDIYRDIFWRHSLLRNLGSTIANKSLTSAMNRFIIISDIHHRLATMCMWQMISNDDAEISKLLRHHIVVLHILIRDCLISLCKTQQKDECCADTASLSELVQAEPGTLLPASKVQPLNKVLLIGFIFTSCSYKLNSKSYSWDILTLLSYEQLRNVSEFQVEYKILTNADGIEYKGYNIFIVNEGLFSNLLSCITSFRGISGGNITNKRCYEGVSYLWT